MALTAEHVGRCVLYRHDGDMADGHVGVLTRVGLFTLDWCEVRIPRYGLLHCDGADLAPLDAEGKPCPG